MKRRSFLKQTATAGLATWITPSTLVTILKADTPNSKHLSFAAPEKEYAPHTWWHWMNGNISKEGITLDLEAMSELGLGGFQMFEVGTGIPKGPITYLSQQWLAMVEHTIKECKRLGLEFAMHNCPGWSSSGGPWINPQLAMQQLTWSETTVNGGIRFQQVLPEPPKRLDYYKDAFVIAFPAAPGEKTRWTTLLKEIRINNKPIDLGLMSIDGQFKTPLALGQPDADSFIDFLFKEPYQLKSLTMLSSGNGKLILQYDQGKAEPEIIKVLTAENPGNANSYPSYITANFTNIRASHYRLTFFGILKISSLSFSETERIENWLTKANFPGTKADLQSTTTTPSDNQAIPTASVIDLSNKVLPNGGLDWDVPAGEWTILRFGHTAVGRMNKSAPSTGTGLDCDKFSKSAIDYHWKHMFENILPLLSSPAGGKVGLLIDSYEMGLQNWSATFPEEFQKRQHYSLMPYLPALTGRIMDSADITEHFLRDFRKAQADVMADNYYGRFAELCRANGITSYTEPYEGGNFEEIKIGRVVDVSMGEFWAGHTMLYNNSILDRTMKVAASIAHSKGQSIVGAESFTAEPCSGKWQQYPFAMKSLGDLMFTKGLTRIIFHRYAHQPHPTALPGMTMGPWGIHFDRTNTWFYRSREWISYLSRCQYMLRKGAFVADIAYYIGETAPEKTINPEHTKWSPPMGYDYDLINSDCLLNECHMKNGRLQNQHDVSYKLLILPDIEIISLPVLRKLLTLANDGLVIIGNNPVHSFGLKDLEAKLEFEALLSKLRGFMHSDISNTLQKLELAPDFSYTAKSTDAAVNYIHRKEKDRDIYFVANRRRRRENMVCNFRVTNCYPELWDPQTGQTTLLPFYEVKKNRIVIPLLFEPSGSVFVIFTQRMTNHSYQSLSLNGNPLISTVAYPAKPKGLHSKTRENFTVSCWVKPETDISVSEDGFYGERRTNNYAVYPIAGETYYGKGHAGSGFTIGRNGLVLFERSNNFINAVLFVEVPISGWSQLAIVYEKNIPSVYLNGELVKVGRSSGHSVHPSVGESYQDDLASYYNGELFDLKLIDQVLPAEVISKTTNILPPPEHVTDIATLTGGGKKLCLWKNGSYLLKDNLGKVQEFEISQLPKVKQINGNWTVRFPDGNGAPEKIQMESLLALQKHSDPGVRYFSGTAEYLIDFNFTTPNYTHQVRLDLGRVEVLAEVTLNGTTFPALWSQPYSLDVTSALNQGTNKLSIKVTNLWPNRLIGDEQLPVEDEFVMPASDSKLAIGGAGGIKKLPYWYTQGLEKPPGGRITFSTWKHYHKNSPLLESGLLGPVQVVVGALRDLTE